jgi:hypothetical protein
MWGDKQMDAPPAATCLSQAHRARPHHRPQAPRTPSQGAGAADENHHHPRQPMNFSEKELEVFAVNAMNEGIDFAIEKIKEASTNSSLLNLFRCEPAKALRALAGALEDMKFKTNTAPKS